MENLFNFVRFESLGQTQHRTAMKRFSIIAILLLSALQTFGAVRLPAVLSDGMVLQRNQAIKVWGWADSDEKFEISWNGETYHVSAYADGREHSI